MSNDNGRLILLRGDCVKDELKRIKPSLNVTFVEKNGFKPGLNHLWSGRWRSARGVVLVKDAEQIKRVS